MSWDGLTSRFEIIGDFLSERIHFGLPPADAAVGGREVVFVLDGVGGLQLAPAMVQRALRDNRDDTPVILHRWQFGLVGEVWTDLMWCRRNWMMGMRFARRLQAFHKANPQTRIHVIAYSGGAGIAVFACEKLRRQLIDTLLLISPSLSPGYNLGPALAGVTRCYSLVSPLDHFFLGWGTRTFGTTDRKLSEAAGKIGFRLPLGAGDEDLERYERLQEIHWSDRLGGLRHAGGHTGWIAIPFLRKHLMPILHGTPRLATSPVPPPAVSETPHASAPYEGVGAAPVLECPPHAATAALGHYTTPVGAVHKPDNVLLA